MNDYKHSRSNVQRSGGLALYIRKLELYDEDDDVQKRKANKADVMLRVCFRPPNQVNRQMKCSLRSYNKSHNCQSFFSLGNLPDMCWKCHTTERKQSRAFLECVKDTTLRQLVRETTRKGVPPDLLLVTEKDWQVMGQFGGCHGHSYHEMVRDYWKSKKS